jgi:gamma-glutamylputrescine oxidase
MTTEEHIDSYYAATANPAPRRAALEGELSVDVCVVGGGLSGCSTALHLAERGYRVALLEGRRVGWGASGRSGGQAIAGFASSQDTLVGEVGPETARRMWDVSVEAVQLLDERIRRHSIDCDLHWGQMHVAVKPRHVTELKGWQREMSDTYGYRGTRWIERDEVRQWIASERYLGGLYDPRSGHLHPLNYTIGLAAAAEAAGVRIFEDSRVTRIDRSDPAVVSTTAGRVRARHVAICCNAWIDELVPELRARIMPVGTYIVATERLGEERMHALLKEPIAVSDVNWVLDYFRPSADHRLLFGGRVSYSGLDPRNTGEATRQRMIRVFPQLGRVKIEYAWGGYVDITMSRAPDFGRLAPHIYYLQGFSGHGIALTGMAGKLAAEAIAGQSERFDLFTRLRHRNFPGGKQLRTPLLVLAMLWFRMKDLL